MAFCSRYDSRSEYLFDVDEIIIPFHNSDKNLAEFIEAHSNQRVIIDVKDEWRSFFTAIFSPIVEKYNNIAIRLAELTPEVISELQKLKVPYFVNKVFLDWEGFYLAVENGVSDVYIGGQLGFELADVARAAAKAQVRIRIYPNVAQSLYSDTDPLKTFFIRPEDVDLYNRRYVSTFEFYFPEKLDLNWDVLYRAYAINKKWNGPLNEIILGLDSDINNTTISPRWGMQRMDCHRRCLKGSSCTICKQIYELSKTLEKVKVQYKPPEDTKEAAKHMMEEIDRAQINSEEPFKPPVIPNF